MATAAKPTQGVKLKRGDGGGSEVFTIIAELTSVPGVERTRNEIDATSLDSTDEEVLVGIRRAGSIQIEGNFVSTNAQQQGLNSDFEAGTLRNFQIDFNDRATPTTYSFAAYITALKFGGGGVDEVQKMTATLRISGAVTESFGS